MSKRDKPASGQVDAKQAAAKATPAKAAAARQPAAKPAALNVTTPKSAASKDRSSTQTSTKKTARKRTTPARPSGSATHTQKSAAGSGKAPTRKPPATQDLRTGKAPAHTPQPKNLLRVSMPVRWRDLDAFNHVNNAKFLSYLEEARLQWLMTLPGDWIDENIAPLVAAAHINYLRPIEWPNEVAIELFVERLGNTSLTIGHRIAGATDTDALFADGYVVMVWIDRQGGTSAALPEVVRTACTAA